MYVDRLLEEKKRLNLSSRTIADMTTHHLSEDTVSRVLARKTDDPGIVTIEDIAGALGLELYELFMDAARAAEFKAFLELESHGEESETERIKLLAELEMIRETNAGNVDRLRVLEVENAHQKEKVKLMEDKIKLMEDKFALAEELLGIYRPAKKAPKFLTLD